MKSSTCFGVTLRTTLRRGVYYRISTDWRKWGLSWERKNNDSRGQFYRRYHDIGVFCILPHFFFMLKPFTFFSGRMSCCVGGAGKLWLVAPILSCTGETSLWLVVRTSEKSVFPPVPRVEQRYRAYYSQHTAQETFGSNGLLWHSALKHYQSRI